MAFDLSNPPLAFLRPPSSSQETWPIMQNGSTVWPLSLWAQNSLLPLDFSVGTTQDTVVPQRGWEIPFEGEVSRHADGIKRRHPISFVNRNSGVGPRLPENIQDHNHDPCERDDETPPKRMTHITINVGSQVSANPSSLHMFLIESIATGESRKRPFWPFPRGC